MKKLMRTMLISVLCMLLCAAMGEGALVLPENLTEIEAEAFMNASEVESVIISEKVHTIGDRAFKGSGLSAVILPATVKNIGTDAFDEDVVIWAEEGSAAAQWAEANGRELRTIVSVNLAADNADIQLGNTITWTAASGSSLKGCDFKWEIFRDGKTVQTHESSFADYTFLPTQAGNWSAKISVFHSGVKLGESSAASVNVASKSANPASDFEYSVSSNGASIYGYKGTDPHVIIPKTIEKKKVIGVQIYDNDTVETIILPEDGSIKKVHVTECEELTAINIPASVETQENMGGIGFSGNDELKTVYLAEGIARINRYLFGGCESLRDIAIPESVTEIGDSAFYSCKSLQKITIPAGVTKIGNSVFWGCRSLEEITIPATVTKIGERVFEGCESLKEISIPEGVTKIGDGLFFSCTSLAKVNVPSSVIEIDDFAFAWCDSLQEINIPDGVTKISYYAFAGCESVAKVSIPSGVNEIDDYAFLNCYALTEINIPAGVTEIGDSAFRGCYKLNTIWCNAGTSGASTITEYGEAFVDSDCPDYLFKQYADESGAVYLAVNGCIGALETLAIPGKINGVPVKEIAPQAFSNLTSLKSVTFTGESALTSIGYGAFSACFNLESINIPETMTHIGHSAFNECNLLKEIVLPSGLTEISHSAFSYCESITKITVPYGVKTINQYAFAGCESLTEVTLPSGLTVIDVGSFSFCVMLEQINIPDSVTSIAPYAFESNKLNTFWCNAGTSGASAVTTYGKVFVDPDYPDYKLKQYADESGSLYLNITGYTGSETAPVYPTEIKGVPVRAA